MAVICHPDGFLIQTASCRLSTCFIRATAAPAPYIVTASVRNGSCGFAVGLEGAFKTSQPLLLGVEYAVWIDGKVIVGGVFTDGGSIASNGSLIATSDCFREGWVDGLRFENGDDSESGSDDGDAKTHGTSWG